MLRPDLCAAYEDDFANLNTEFLLTSFFVCFRVNFIHFSFHFFFQDGADASYYLGLSRPSHYATRIDLRRAEFEEILQDEDRGSTAQNAGEAAECPSSSSTEERTQLKSKTIYLNT